MLQQVYYNICKVVNTKEINMKKYAITYGMKIVDYANSREEAQQMVKAYREITNDKMYWYVEVK